MRWRWLIFDYVDPALGLTPAERRRVRFRAWETGMGPDPDAKPVHERSFNEDILGSGPGAWRKALPAVVPWILIVVGLPICMRHLSTGTWHLMLVYPIVIAATWLTAAWVGRVTWRPRVTRALREMGYDVCAECGYRLEGLGGAAGAVRCPECGLTRSA